MLQTLQRRTSGVARDKRHESLLGKYRDMLPGDSSRVHAQERLARLNSLQHGRGTCWLEVKPTKDHWELDDATVKSTLRFMLGVNPGPPHQACFKCACGYREVIVTMLWCVTSSVGLVFRATIMFNHWCNVGLLWLVSHLVLNHRNGT
jgi:hypothetical protein